MIEITDQLISSWVSHFLWPFFRLSSFFVLVPILGARLVPTRVRLGLAFMITLLIYPALPEMPLLEAVDIQTFIIILEQILIGTTLGFIVFAIMTPIGIILGEEALQGLGNLPLLTPIFSALAAGTFLYIGTLHGLRRAIMIERCCNMREFSLMLCGFGLMAVVAIWT